MLTFKKNYFLTDTGTELLDYKDKGANKISMNSECVSRIPE